MAEKTAIIHSDSIGRAVSDDAQCNRHTDLVAAVRQRPGVIEIKSTQPAWTVGVHIQAGDHVTVYGSRGDCCVLQAALAILGQGATFDYGPEEYSILPWPPKPIADIFKE